MERGKRAKVTRKKKERRTIRAANTPLFLLRSVQVGLSVSDLDLLSIGMVNDMFTESKNDGYEYPIIGTQADIDAL